VIDTTGGASAMGVKDLSGDIARSLRLTRASTTATIDGEATKVIDGTSSHSIDLSDLDISSAAIPLSSLNNGAGVAAGDILITDSAGKQLVLDLNGGDAGITTVGELIDAINDKANAAGVGVTATINSAGTGIRLENTAPGSGKLKVEDVNSTAAADLKIAGEGTLVGGAQVINGAGAFTATSATQSGLSALAAKINSLGAGVTASTVFDGAAYRLSIAVDATGSANELLVDSGDSGLQFEEVAKAQDALLLYGNLSSPSGGVLLSSTTNTFTGAVGGVDLAVSASSDAPVTVSVQTSDESLVDAVEDMVDAYNALRADLDKLTAFDSEALTTGLLFGTNEALQIDSRLSRVLTDRFRGVGSFQALKEIGLSVAGDGKLELNKSRLKSAFETKPEALREFFSNSESGVAAKISAAVDRLAGADESLLASRSDALQSTIAANQSRIDRFTTQLEKQEERLFMQFYQLEQIIAKLQQSQTALENMQVIPPLVNTRS
jgi:flagellar hook-associated protein 2